MRSLALALILATPFAAAAALPISSGEILSRGASGVGYSYWWGHGGWDAGGVSWPGGCRGSCGACTHYPSRTRNDGTRESGPEFGADCSGFVAKAWRVPDSNSNTGRDSHPYSTADFNVDRRGSWKTVRDVQPGDARVRRSGGGGHIYLVESVGARGGLSSMEANGCSRGILRMSRSTGERGYKTIRREGLSSANQPPAVPAVPRGRATAAVGQDVSVCTSGTDPDRNQLKYHLIASTDPQRAEVMRVSTPLVRSGTEMCATVRFEAAGRYVVEARSEDEHQAFSAARSRPLVITVQAAPTFQRYDLELTYGAVPAQLSSPDGRTLDLDLFAELPAGGGTLAHAQIAGGVPASDSSYPFAGYLRGDCAGCTETIRLTRALEGEYVLWAYDYENSASAEDAMGRARAQVRVFSVAADGARQEVFRYSAPGGSYNRWNVARINFDSSGQLVSAGADGSTASENLFAP